MGGFGGAMKQLSIGCGSTKGKCYIHTAGAADNMNDIWTHIAPQQDFCDSMADAACSVINLYKGNLAYVNVMKNISIDCDCNGHAKAPELPDMGILASLDPIAIDKACYDIIDKCNEKGRDAWIKRVTDKCGLRTLETGAKLGLGSMEYELVNIE